MNARFSPLLSLAAVLLLGSAAAHAEPQSECTMHLVVELTPDVPNPQDAGFLSSLLNDNPAYRLNWVKKVDMSFIQLELTGPGPLDRCEAVVETMRRDGRVLSVYPEPEETNTVSVAAQRHDDEPPKVGPRISVSPYGFGALYWAALHPSESWRIVMPVEPSAPETAGE
jgi:hypothetical protein